jgi:CHAD domain-containing protein
MNDYLLPEEMTPAVATKALDGELQVRNGHTREIDRIYYDSFDGLLRGQGLQGEWEDGWFSLTERGTGSTRARVAMRRPKGPMFTQDLEPGTVADALRPLLDVRALLPIAEVHTRERQLDILNSDQKTVARIQLQWSSVGSRKLKPRVHLAGVRGYERALERLAQTMTSRLRFDPAELSLADEAVIAGGGRPGGVAGKLSVPLGAQDQASRAAAAVLKALLDVIEANLEGTIADLDSEFLHDLRVSVRRSRSVQREFRWAFPPAELTVFRAGFRRLQQVTGPVRDLDVWLLEFREMTERVPEALRPDLDRLLAVLRDRRRTARRRMLAALRAPRTTSLLADWRAFLERPDGDGRQPGRDASRPIGALAGERIRKVYRGMVQLGAIIDPSSPAESYHELRKRGKELRYLLELFGAPLYPEHAVKPMIRVLKDLQDVLGAHQDREVQISSLRLLAPEVGGGPGVTGAAMAMGVLIERLDEDRLAARGAFPARFEAFAVYERRGMVKRVFG